MPSSSLPGFIFIATILVSVGCGSVEISPGSGGSSGSSASSTTGASQSSSGAGTSSSTGPKPGYCITDDDCVGDPGRPLCDLDTGACAATQWLTVDAPVVPRETFKLDLMVFDVSDDAGDTSVLLDNFRWIFSIGCLGCGPP